MKLNIKSGARAGAYSAALTAVVIAVVIVVNLIVGALPSKYTKLDTSRESMFTFDEKTESFITALTEDVTVYHISQEGAEDPYLTEILDRYEDMNSHITVRRIDPAKQPTFTEKYTEDALANNSLVIESRDRFKIVPASDVYYIYCEDMGGKVDTQTFNYYYQMYAQYGQTLEYSQIFAGESVVAAGIDYVTMTDIPKLYILAGHDEPSLNSSLTEWLKLKNYEIETLYEYAGYMASNKALLFGQKEQDRRLAKAKEAEYQQKFGKFWQENEEGEKSVQIAKLNNGKIL